MVSFKFVPRACLAIACAFAQFALGQPDKPRAFDDGIDDRAGFRESDRPTLAYHEQHGAGVLRRPQFFDDQRTVAERMARGQTFDEARRHLIGDGAAYLFDEKSGHLALPARPTEPGLALASESGSQPLLALQGNYAFSAAEAPVKDALLEDYRRILSRLPGIELILAVRREDERELFWEISRWPPSLSARVFIFAHSYHWSPWAQDLAKPALNSLTSLGGGDFTHNAERVNEVFRGYVETHSLPFKMIGGNVVVGDRDIFVGTGFVKTLMGQLWSERSEIIGLLTHVFGKPVTEIGGPNDTVSFHLDLDVAVVRDWTADGHREVILLQSPVLLIEALLGKKVAPFLSGFPSLDPVSINKFNVYRREALRELEGLKDIDPDARLTWQTLLKRMDLAAIGMEELKYRYYRESFGALGYRVLGLPGTAILHRTRDATAIAATSRPMGGPPNFVSYANLVASGATAIVGNYKIPRIDGAAYDVLHRLGYEVIPVKSTIGTMRWNGGIRCLHATHRETVSSCGCARALGN